MSLLLAGDVGGTKTVLCLYEAVDGGLSERDKQTFPSGRHEAFNHLLREYLQVRGLEAAGVAAACFGVAGPVQNQRCDATNLPWVIDAREMKQVLGLPRVMLLNDLEAAAYGMLHLGPEDLVELNPRALEQPGHSAVIAAGTGLGEAILFFDGERHHAMPTEGGHCDFAPQNAREDALLLYLRERFLGHVSVERILAGNGFGTLYDFLKQQGFAPADELVEAEMASGDRNAVISRHGLSGSDPLCREVVGLFCRIYGAEAGNLALKCLPAGGVYIGGGIGPKIRSALESGVFMEGFLDKGRMRRAIEHVPVRLALNPETPLLGAAHKALEQIQS